MKEITNPHRPDEGGMTEMNGDSCVDAAVYPTPPHARDCPREKDWTRHETLLVEHGRELQSLVLKSQKNRGRIGSVNRQMKEMVREIRGLKEAISGKALAQNATLILNLIVLVGAVWVMAHRGLG